MFIELLSPVAHPERASLTCKCHSSLPQVSSNTSVVAFSRLSDTSIGHYHHSLVAHGSKLAMFGGHLCSSTKEASNHPFYYLNWVESLDLSPEWAPEPLTAFVPADLSENNGGKDEL